MLFSFLWSAQISEPLLFFFRFQGLAHAVEDAVRLLAIASLDVTPLLVAAVVVVNVTLVLDAVVVVAVVMVTLLAVDEVLFLPAPALTPTALPFSQSLLCCILSSQVSELHFFYMSPSR